jgi:hypothetical protein
VDSSKWNHYQEGVYELETLSLYKCTDLPIVYHTTPLLFICIQSLTLHPQWIIDNTAVSLMLSILL